MRPPGPCSYRATNRTADTVTRQGVVVAGVLVCILHASCACVDTLSCSVVSGSVGLLCESSVTP